MTYYNMIANVEINNKKEKRPGIIVNVYNRTDTLAGISHHPHSTCALDFLYTLRYSISALPEIVRPNCYHCNHQLHYTPRSLQRGFSQSSCDSKSHMDHVLPLGFAKYL